MIIALVCMGFMVLLLLSLNMLSSTELSVDKQQETLARARSNAILGLNVALGELQATLGPDQRISATAGIRSSASAGRAHWTGAWKSNPAGGQAADTDFLGWLVSLPDGITNTQTTADTSVGWTTLPNGQQQPSDEDWVALVGTATVGNAATPGGVSPLVMAGVVALPNEGHYAWWVGDEGVKARVNLPTSVLEPDVAADDAENLMRNLLSPSHNAVQKIGSDADGTNGALGNLSANDSGLARLDLLSQLPLLSPGVDADVSREHFHDLTLHSRGLLTDTRNGGLRLDLSHLLDSANSTAFTRQFGSGSGESWDSTYVFTPPGAGISFNYGAPNWGIIRSFYQLPQSISNNKIAPIVPNDGTRSSLYAPYQNANSLYQTNNLVAPMLSWAQLVIGLEYKLEKDEADNDIYEPYLHIRPLIALYNPYDIELNGAVYDIQWLLSPLIEIEVNGKNAVQFRLSEMTPANRLRLRIPAAISNLRPGETRYYGLDNTYDLGNSLNSAQMKADWDEEASYYVRLRDVRTSSKTGATASERPENSDYWGLTDGEKDLLAYAPEEGIDPLGIAVRFDVRFDPTENADTKYKDEGGLLVLRIGNDLITYLQFLYRVDHPDRRPRDVSNTLTLGSIGLTPDLFWFGIGMRTIDSAKELQRQFIDANPRFLQGSVREEGFDGEDGFSILSGWTGNSKAPSGSSAGWLESWTDYSPQLSNTERFSGNFGHSRGTGGNGSVILYHVPRQAPRSLGIFQHAALGRFSRHQGYMVGNSYAPPRIAPDKTLAEPFTTHDSGRAHNAYDWAYAINLELWDKYYLSAIPQDLTDTQLRQYLDGSRTLPNPRLRLTSVDGVSPSVSRLTDASNADTATTASAHLLLEGPLNVNSTSVDAWKALLASNTELAIPVYSATTGNFVSSNPETGAVFYRTPVNFDDSESTSDNSSRFWGSYRRLNDTELTQLAQEIVAEVKQRAPFGSLADFINRRPSAPATTPELRERGALQAALDKTINANLPGGTSGQSGAKAQNVAIPGYDTGYTTDEDRTGTGAPGWLLQGDLLQAIGPLLAARSDTFIIRAYGDATDAQGNITARAWCEAVVQRSVSKVDPSETIAEAGPADSFGRRFNVIGFRWLDAP